MPFAPKGKDRLPTIHFQGQTCCSFQGPGYFLDTSTFQGIVGCTPTNVPLGEIPIWALYIYNIYIIIYVYSEHLWVVIPKNPKFEHNKHHGSTRTLGGTLVLVPWTSRISTHVEISLCPKERFFWTSRHIFTSIQVAHGLFRQFLSRYIQVYHPVMTHHIRIYPEYNILYIYIFTYKVGYQSHQLQLGWNNSTISRVE